MKSRKWPALNVLKIYADFSHQKWNALLSAKKAKHDIAWLMQTLYGMQAGMTDDSTKALLQSSPGQYKKILNWFIRIQRSIENTAREIFRAKYPNPLDNPLNAEGNFEYLESKRLRDRALESFLREASF